MVSWGHGPHDGDVQSETERWMISAFCQWREIKWGIKCHQLWPASPWALPCYPQILPFSPSVRSHLPRRQEPVLGFHSGTLKKSFCGQSMKRGGREREGTDEREDKRKIIFLVTTSTSSGIATCQTLSQTIHLVLSHLVCTTIQWSQWFYWFSLCFLQGCLFFREHNWVSEWLSDWPTHMLWRAGTRPWS